MNWGDSGRGGLKTARQFAGRLIREYDNLKGTSCQEANRDFRNIFGPKTKFPFWNEPVPKPLPCDITRLQTNFCDL
jgi:hypothetical protein